MESREGELREISLVQDDQEELTKRWFSCDEMDLFIWCDQAGVMQELQLTSDKKGNERAVVWRLHCGVSVNAVDVGSRPGKHPGSPIFREVEGVDVRSIVSRFEQFSSSLDPKIVSGVLAALS